MVSVFMVGQLRGCDAPCTFSGTGGIERFLDGSS
jgi:hypothetical protein